MLPRKRVQSNATPIGLVLVALALSLGVGGTVGTVFALLAKQAPAWRPVAAATLLVVTAGMQRALMPSAARLLRRRKETLLAALG
jgi:xanthosine utilization system XapX-like protein